MRSRAPHPEHERSHTVRRARPRHARSTPRAFTSNPTFFLFASFPYIFEHTRVFASLTSRLTRRTSCRPPTHLLHSPCTIEQAVSGAIPMDAKKERSLARVDHAVLELKSIKRPAGAPRAYEKKVRELEASVARLDKLALELDLLDPSRSTEGRATEFLKERLRRGYMIPLSRSGKRLFRFASIEQTLKTPHARASLPTLLASAEAMFKAVRRYRKLLVADGFLGDISHRIQRAHARASPRRDDELPTASEARQGEG